MPTDTGLNLLRAGRRLLLSYIARGSKFSEGSTGTVDYNITTYGVDPCSYRVDPDQQVVQVQHTKCSLHVAGMNSWRLDRASSGSRRAACRPQKAGGSRCHGSRPSSQNQTIVKGKLVPSIETAQSGQEPEPERPLVSTRLLVILLASGAVGVLAGAVTAIEAWLKLHEELGNSGALVVAVFAWLTAWSLVTLSVAGVLHRLVG